eukprot:1188860-Prorocentrum_minimum.AAC.2
MITLLSVRMFIAQTFVYGRFRTRSAIPSRTPAVGSDPVAGGAVGSDPAAGGDPRRIQKWSAVTPRKGRHKFAAGAGELPVDQGEGDQGNQGERSDMIADETQWKPMDPPGCNLAWRLRVPPPNPPSAV